MKVALVYDRVNKFGGAERVLLALHKIWPEAPLYTAVYDSQGAPWAKNFSVIPSFAQKFPLAKKQHEIYPSLMPFAFESFNFDKFEVVISVTSAEAKGIITKPKTLHLCYCLTPTRYLWSSYEHYINNYRFGVLNPLAKLVIKPLLKKLKEWDQVACQRPDDYIAISKTVQKRIEKYYQRPAEIIYPPVDTSKFRCQGPAFTSQITGGKNHVKARPLHKGYFLVVSRLVSYKRIDIIIQAFNELGWPLKIIGEGKERKNLEKIAKPNIKFIHQGLTDSELLRYYQECLGLVFIGEEDLGLVALEAQACGKPVIACKIGGIAEVVVDGQTGVLFGEQTPEALKQALRQFKVEKFNPVTCRQNALQYSEKVFINKFKSFVEGKWKYYQKTI